MSKFAAVAIAAILTLGAGSASLAQGTMNGVQHGTGAAKARCSPGDANVLVDQKTKTYVLDTSANKPMKGTSGAPAPGSMTGAMSSAAGTKPSLVSMCKSEAVSMGAQMKGKPSQ